MNHSVNQREFLEKGSSMGFGMLALGDVFSNKLYPEESSLAPRAGRVVLKARSVIILYMDGGCVKDGASYCATDAYGCRAIKNKMTVHYLHANMMHLIGIDHTKLTCSFRGWDVRLTDVPIEIIPDIVA